jgi:nucleoside-diphosphate kinase
MSAVERSLLVIKPNAYNRRDQILAIVEQYFTIVNTTWGIYDIDHWKQHYIEHEGKMFYLDLCREMADQETMAVIVSGPNAVNYLRTLIGATDPKKAVPGTLRYQFGETNRHNAVHGSDSVESAEREIALWFK